MMMVIYIFVVVYIYPFYLYTLYVYSFHNIKRMMITTTNPTSLSVSKHPSSIPQSPTVYNPKRIFPFFGVKK